MNDWVKLYIYLYIYCICGGLVCRLELVVIVDCNKVKYLEEFKILNKGNLNWWIFFLIYINL